MVTVKLSDWVAQKCADFGIRHVFMVTGGGAMHLNHSLGTHPDIECIFNHHEQACAMGAEAYYRLNNKLALVNVTSGPGGTNAITGVYGAYVDSIGMVIISGQVKFETTVRSTGMPLRQFGDQELDIEELVRPITKYCVMVTDPKTIRFHLEKAFYLAKFGRPGPVWLDIPLDVQNARIDPGELIGFDPAELKETWKDTDLQSAAKSVLRLVREAKRPVVFAGSGVRLSGKHNEFIEFVEKIRIPVVGGWNAHDVIWETHPLYCGRPGTIGDRAGNFTVQNADLLIILGSRLNIRQVSYNWKSFAREAFKVWVDIDPLELNKPSVRADLPIHANLSEFLPVIANEPYDGAPDHHKSWVEWCLKRRKRYPTVEGSYYKSPEVNPYLFMDSLFDLLDEDQIIVTGNGSACVISFQVAKLKRGQRLWTNSGCASMGYDLPAAIGVSKASPQSKIVCLAGDGSIMMNLQELQTITSERLPIKIFILNNNGYSSIFQTHRNFFNGVEVGAGPKSGVTFPSFKKIAAAFDIEYNLCSSHESIAQVISATMNSDAPAICEVMIDPDQLFAPKLGAKQHPDGRITSPPLEDLSPFLTRAELLDNLFISPLDE